MVTLQFWFSSYQTACSVNVNWPATKTNWDCKNICTEIFRSTPHILWLTTHQAKNLAHMTHFICNLHNQKLQHYMLGKNPISVQSAITLAQKKRMQNYALLKAYIIMIQDMKLTTYIMSIIIMKIIWDTAMLVTAHI